MTKKFMKIYISVVLKTAIRRIRGIFKTIFFKGLLKKEILLMLCACEGG